jgi:hypothetical protein
MHRTFALCACLAALFTVGCASIVSESIYPVTFDTNPSGHEITVTSQAGPLGAAMCFGSFTNAATCESRLIVIGSRGVGPWSSRAPHPPSRWGAGRVMSRLLAACFSAGGNSGTTARCWGPRHGMRAHVSAEESGALNTRVFRRRLR